MELREKYDLLIHTVKELNLSKPKQLAVVKELFPKFDSKITDNDKLLTDYIIEAYSYSRSLGLSIEDSANSVKITSTLMHKLLSGEELSLDRFVSLIESEIYASAEMKVKHLKKLDTTADKTVDTKASISFLEKIYPTIYGPRATVTHGIADELVKKWELEISHVDVKVKKESSAKDDEK